MFVFRASEVTGYTNPIKMRSSKMNHMQKDGLVAKKNTDPSSNVEESFGELLKKMFYDVNSIELRKDEMMNQFIMNPDSINIEDLSIAMSKAELTVGFVKTVADRVISAYRDISNLR